MPGDRIAERGQHAVVFLASAVGDPQPSRAAEQPPGPDHDPGCGQVRDHRLFDLSSALAERNPREVGCGLGRLETDRREAGLDPLTLGDRSGDLSANSSPWASASVAAAWASALTLNGWRTASTAARNSGDEIE